RQPAIHCRGLELLDRLDAKRLVNLANPRRTQAGNRQHLDESLWHRRLELLEIPGRARVDEIPDHRQGGWSEAANLAQLTGAIERTEILHRERADLARRAGVGACLERALALQLEIRRDPRQDVRGGARVHGGLTSVAFDAGEVAQSIDE